MFYSVLQASKQPTQYNTTATIVLYCAVSYRTVPCQTHCKPKEARGNLDPSARVAMGLMVASVPAARASCGELGSNRPEAVTVEVPNAAAAMVLPAW